MLDIPSFGTRAWRRIAVVLLVSTLAVSALPAQGQSCDLECSLAAMLKEEGLPGAAYSIVDGDVVRIGAVGVANHARGDRLRPDAKVHIGSVTKTMIALGVLRLATLERLDLDTPLSQLLPQVQLDNRWQARAPVTLRHLLDHTAGLEDLRLWHIFTARAEPNAPLADAFERTPDVLRVRSEPGTQFAYSNIGYTLAGMVIEAVTGERYETWLDRELLGPLGANDSTFQFVTQAGPNADPRLAWGHYDDLTAVPALPIWVRPAAQFTTTAADMARIARFLMSDGQLDQATFVDAGLLRQMGHATTTRAAKAGLEVGYALGLSVRDRYGAVGSCHTGNIIGFRAALCMYPQQGKAYFIAHNGDNEDARYGRFDALMTKTLGVATPAAPAVEPAEAPVAWEGRYVTAPPRFEMFRYFELLFDSTTLDVGASGVELGRLGSPVLQLTPVGPHLYRAADRVVASHALLSNDGAADTITTGTRTLRKVSDARYALAWTSLVLGVIGLLALLVAIPSYRIRYREPLMQPASLALVLLLMPLPLFALQPFTALGDVTPASVTLFVATLMLPVLLAIHSIWVYRDRQRLRAWLLHLVSVAFVLQWCVSLYTWDLLPFSLWN